MKRRLNIAVALIHDPDLIVLDEPTVGVDPQSRTRILDGIAALGQAGKTIIYTTHYMEEAQRLCQRVGIIDHGRLLDLDTVDGLLSRHGGPDVVIATLDEGEKRMETADPVAELARLQTAGGLRSFRVDRPNLESVFIHLTGRALRD
ncbi:MAG: ABC transporter ATP-binding protein, partial [Planctomycetota bacterium]